MRPARKISVPFLFSYISLTLNADFRGELFLIRKGTKEGIPRRRDVGTQPTGFVTLSGNPTSARLAW